MERAAAAAASERENNNVSVNKRNKINAKKQQVSLQPQPESRG